MSTSYTEKTHSAFHGAPIDTSDPKTLAWLIRRHGLEMTHISRGSHIGAIFQSQRLWRCSTPASCALTRRIRSGKIAIG